MADLTITKANVIKGANSTVVNGIAGATITAGQAVYEDTTDSGKIKLADANGATALIATCKGIALNDALAGQPISYIVGNDLGLGAILTVGTVYILSATAGGICPDADSASGMRKTIIGVATTTSNLRVALNSSGALIA